MAKNDETVEPTVTFNKKKLTTAGWIAGGVLALGATFAAGAAVGHAIDGPRGGDFASGQFGPQGEQHGGPHGDMHGGPKGGHGMGDRDGDVETNDDGQGMGGMMAPTAPQGGTTNNGSTTPAPATTP